MQKIDDDFISVQEEAIKSGIDIRAVQLAVKELKHMAERNLNIQAKETKNQNKVLLDFIHDNKPKKTKKPNKDKKC